MQVLLVEDNVTIAKGLKYSFNQEGYTLIHKKNVKEAEEVLKKGDIDLVILDISLPDGNGLNFYIQKIKKLKIPTIFLTAKDDEETIVKGLESGADDYITKPFSTRELIARINKIVLRKKENLIIEIKDIKFDLDKMIVYKNDKEIALTSLELKILYLFFTNINKVVTRNFIIDKIWEWTGNDVNDNTVTVYLKRIRQKLDSDIIKTVKGIGYRLDEK